MAEQRIAVYPGTFDPVTNGHLDILQRAIRMFDRVVLAVVEKPMKNTLFTVDERMALLAASLEGRPFRAGVSIERFDGLLVNFAKEKNACTLVRGLRAISDFDYEFQMALMNRHQAPDVETVFLMPDEKYVYLSSSMIKTIGRYRGKLSHFLPEPVVEALRERFA